MKNIAFVMGMLGLFFGDGFLLVGSIALFTGLIAIFVYIKSCLFTIYLYNKITTFRPDNEYAKSLCNLLFFPKTIQKP